MRPEFNRAEVLQWLANGERGLSSNTIVQHLTGIVTATRNWANGHHPHDPDDLWRCRELLRLCPSLVPLFPRMTTCSPAWAALVPAWGRLCRMMDTEAPDWPELGSTAPKTYAEMQRLMAQASAELDAQKPLRGHQT